MEKYFTSLFEKFSIILVLRVFMNYDSPILFFEWRVVSFEYFR